MRIRATEAFEAKPVELREGYWIRERQAIWAFAKGPGNQRIRICLRGFSGETNGHYTGVGYEDGGCTEYSPDCGATWLPIAGTARGLLPGDVLVKAGTVEPLGYVISAPDRGNGIMEIKTSGYANPVWHRETTDILSGPEADAILIDIIKGRYATEAK